MCCKKTSEFLSGKIHRIHQGLWLLPIFGILAFTIVYSFIELPDIQLTHAFFAFVLLYSPALIFDFVIKNKLRSQSHPNTGEIPNTLIVKYDALDSKIVVTFLGLCILIFLPFSIFSYFSEFVGLSRMLLLVTVFLFFPLFKFIKRLKKPFIISFSSTEISNLYDETYLWDDIIRAEIFEDAFLLNVDNGKNYNTLVVFSYETDDLDYCRALAYIKTYAKQEVVKIKSSQINRKDICDPN